MELQRIHIVVSCVKICTRLYVEGMIGLLLE